MGIMISKIAGFWRRVWTDKSEKDKKWIKSFIPLGVYTFVFLYFVIYLSILNTVNRNKTAATVKNWFGGDPPDYVIEIKKEKVDIVNSFQLTRKRVSGGR